MKIVWFSLLCIPIVSGFDFFRNKVINPSVFSKNIPMFSNIHVYEPPSVNKKNTTCLLFFSGGNSLISHDVYSNFLSTIANKNIAIYTIPFKYENVENLVGFLKDEYAEIVPISHSSGSVPLIENVATNPYITRAIFMDPVDARIERNKKIQMTHMKHILILKAEKSYKGSFLPFIPEVLALSKDKLKTHPECKVEVVDSKKYGHCDILNPSYSNIVNQYMKPICDGSADRNSENLYDYMEGLTDIIADFLLREQ